MNYFFILNSEYSFFLNLTIENAFRLTFFELFQIILLNFFLAASLMYFLIKDANQTGSLSFASGNVLLDKRGNMPVKFHQNLPPPPQALELID